MRSLSNLHFRLCLWGAIIAIAPHSMAMGVAARWYTGVGGMLGTFLIDLFGLQMFLIIPFIISVIICIALVAGIITVISRVLKPPLKFNEVFNLFCYSSPVLILIPLVSILFEVNSVFSYVIWDLIEIFYNIPFSSRDWTQQHWDLRGLYFEWVRNVSGVLSKLLSAYIVYIIFVGLKGKFEGITIKNLVYPVILIIPINYVSLLLAATVEFSALAHA